jgi:hypothetical protein
VEAGPAAPACRTFTPVDFQQLRFDAGRAERAGIGCHTDSAERDGDISDLPYL